MGYLRPHNTCTCSYRYANNSNGVKCCLQKILCKLNHSLSLCVCVCACVRVCYIWKYGTQRVILRWYLAFSFALCYICLLPILFLVFSVTLAAMLNLYIWYICVTQFTITRNNPTFSKIEIFVSWCSRCLKPSSVAVSSQ